jgi:hypothetical protein
LGHVSPGLSVSLCSRLLLGIQFRLPVGRLLSIGCVLLLLRCQGCRAGIGFLLGRVCPRLSFSQRRCLCLSIDFGVLVSDTFVLCGTLPFSLCPTPLLCRDSSLLLRIGGRLLLRCLLLHANGTACFCGETSLCKGWFHRYERRRCQ